MPEHSANKYIYNMCMCQWMRCPFTRKRERVSVCVWKKSIHDRFSASELMSSGQFLKWMPANIHALCWWYFSFSAFVYRSIWHLMQALRAFNYFQMCCSSRNLEIPHASQRVGDRNGERGGTHLNFCLWYLCCECVVVFFFRNSHICASREELWLLRTPKKTEMIMKKSQHNIKLSRSPRIRLNKNGKTDEMIGMGVFFISFCLWFFSPVTWIGLCKTFHSLNRALFFVVVFIFCYAFWCVFFALIYYLFHIIFHSGLIVFCCLYAGALWQTQKRIWKLHLTVIIWVTEIVQKC